MLRNQIQAATNHEIHQEGCVYRGAKFPFSSSVLKQIEELHANITNLQVALEDFYGRGRMYIHALPGSGKTTLCAVSKASSDRPANRGIDIDFWSFKHIDASHRAKFLANMAKHAEELAYAYRYVSAYPGCFGLGGDSDLPDIVNDKYAVHVWLMPQDTLEFRSKCLSRAVARDGGRKSEFLREYEENGERWFNGWWDTLSWLADTCSNNQLVLSANELSSLEMLAEINEVAAFEGNVHIVTNLECSHAYNYDPSRRKFILNEDRSLDELIADNYSQHRISTMR